MKIVYLGVVFAIILVSVFTYLFIFPKEKEVKPPETTTTITEVPATTTTVTEVVKKIIIISEVSIYSDRFEPSEIRVKINEKLKWINKDSKQHEVVCVDANQNPLFDAILNPEESWEFYMYANGECWDPSVSEQGMRMRIIAE